MGVKKPIGEWLDVPTDAITWSLVYLFGTGAVYATSAGFSVLPESFRVGFAAVFLVFWLGSPIALYLDRRFVAARTGWQPAKWFYLSVLPGYLGVAFLAWYIYERSGFGENVTWDTTDD